MKRRITWAALAIAALVSGAPAVAQQNELRVAYSTFAGELVDPIHGGLASQIYQMPVFDYLVTFDNNMRFTPGLAERWEMTDQGRTYTFHLRRGVRWHSGEEFTSDDVRFHFTRLARGTGPYIGPLLAVIDSIETPDPYTVVFRLKNAFPDFLAHLSPGSTTLGAITPRAYIERAGEPEFQSRLIGTGPWRLIDRQRGSYFLYERTGQHAFRPTPSFQRLRLLQVPEASTRIAMLRRGEAHLIDIDPDAADQVRAAGGQVFEVPASVMPFVSFVGVWTERAEALRVPTRDPRVRRALSMAIDRAELVEFLISGRGAPATTFPTFPGGFGYDEAWDRANAVPFDPAGARRLLAEAGYPNGFRLRFYSAPLGGAPWLPRMAEAIAGYWRAIGVQMELVVTDAGALLPVIYARPDDALGAAYTYRTTKSVFPVGVSQNYLVAQGSSQLAVMNWDDAYAQVERETDPVRREAAFRELVQRLQRSYAMIPVLYASALFAGSRGVANWTPVEGWPSPGIAFDALRPAN